MKIITASLTVCAAAALLLSSAVTNATPPAPGFLGPIQSINHMCVQATFQKDGTYNARDIAVWLQDYYSKDSPRVLPAKGPQWQSDQSFDLYIYQGTGAYFAPEPGQGSYDTIRAYRDGEDACMSSSTGVINLDGCAKNVAAFLSQRSTLTGGCSPSAATDEVCLVCAFPTN